MTSRGTNLDVVVRDFSEKEQVAWADSRAIAAEHGFHAHLRTRDELRADLTLLNNLDRALQTIRIHGGCSAAPPIESLRGLATCGEVVRRGELANRLGRERRLADALLDFALFAAHLGGEIKVNFSGEEYGDDTQIQF